MKLTSWFHPFVKPVRCGWYETKFNGYKGYSYWDGNKWSCQCSYIGGLNLSFVIANQNKTWRGIAK